MATIINYESWANAIQQIETGSEPWGQPGDEGQALGPYQMHTTSFWQWAPTPTLGMTWAQWFRLTALAFATAWFRAYPEGTADECAVVYHRHMEIVRASPSDFTADDYLQRFQACYTP